MKKAQKLSALLLALSLVLSMLILAPFTAGAQAPTAVCTVSVSEQNAGTDDYYVEADVTFESEDEFTAGLFSVEAEDLTLTDCTVKSATGGDAPEVQFEADKNKVIFTGFSNSTEYDFRSYTSLTLTLKFELNDGATGTTRKVAVKNITLANIDEVKFVTADAEGTAQDAHTHTLGDWLSDETDHWHVCSGCSVIVDKAAHVSGDWIIDVAATTEAGGHRHKECTVCGYHTAEEDTDPLSGNHTPGDINNDGSVNNKDLTRLFQYLSDWDVEVNESALDINGDGSVNNKDLTRLFQYLSDWDVEIH